jgi:hypothetical protein
MVLEVGQFHSITSSGRQNPHYFPHRTQGGRNLKLESPALESRDSVQFEFSTSGFSNAGFSIFEFLLSPPGPLSCAIVPACDPPSLELDTKDHSSRLRHFAGEQSQQSATGYFLGFGATALLVVAFIILFPFAMLPLIRRATWRVRNRLFVTYFLVGILPIF